MLDPAPTAREIERGYLASFAADHVLDARDGAPTKTREPFGITHEHLRRDRPAADLEVGLPVEAVYRTLWREEFRFVQRREVTAVIPTSPDPMMELFIAACFGAFPGRGSRSELERAYATALNAERLPITAANLLDGFSVTTRDRFLTPLELTVWDLEWRPTRLGAGVTVLLVDDQEPSDILDYWNLRALGEPVVPLPIRWQEDLINPLIERLSDAHARPRWTDESVALVGTHRIRPDSVREVAERLRAGGLTVDEAHYPDLVRGVRRDPPVVTAATADAEMIRGQVDRVPLLSPAAAAESSFGRWRWVNVLNVLRSSAPSDGSVAGVLPEGRSTSRLVRAWSHHDVMSTAEGLVIPGGSTPEEFLCRWPSSTEALHDYFRDHGLAPETSDPGYIATELIRQLGGLEAVTLVQHRELTTVLDRAARQALEIVGSNEGLTRPRQRARSIPRGELQRALEQSAQANPFLDWTVLLQALVARGVLRAGVRLRCPACRFIGWYDLQALGELLRCERCLRDFPFPQAEPPGHSSWEYRPTGAAAVENYAAGAYTVAFALRFLASGLHASSSWCTATQLRKDLEVDFAMLRRGHDRDEDGREALVLGEAKSYNRFERRDVERLRALRAYFPTSTLVVATLRRELDRDEREALGAVAQPDVARVEDIPYPARLIVLTGTELFDTGEPPDCWLHGAGPAAELAKNRAHGGPTLATWADITAVLHLGLPTHAAWANGEWQRVGRRRRRTQPRGLA